jgi:hypothetical protein
MNNEPKFCGDCAELGIPDVKAHRIVGKRGVCEEHYRQRMGLPQRTPEAEAIVERWKTIPAAGPIAVRQMVETSAALAGIETEKPEMARRNLHGINWGDVQADRDKGEMRIIEIAKKHNVSEAQVYAKTRPRKVAAADPAIADVQQDFARGRRGKKKEIAGAESFAIVLRNRRQRFAAEILKIDTVIKALEELDGNL